MVSKLFPFEESWWWWGPQPSGQLERVLDEAVRADLGCLTKVEFRDRRGKLVGGHPGAVHEHGDYARLGIELESQLDLLPDLVVGRVNFGAGQYGRR